MNTRMLLIPSLGLALGCGMLDRPGVAGEPGAGKGHADTPTSVEPGELAAEVRATFVDPAIGATDDPPKLDVASPPAPIVVRDPAGGLVELVPDAPSLDWDRPAPQIPPQLVADEHPDFYVYDGLPVEMGVDHARLAIKCLEPRDAAEIAQLAAAAGVAVRGAVDLGIGRWCFVELDQPALDKREVGRTLGDLKARPEIEHVSPVFHNPEIAGGWLVATADVLVRVRPAFVGDADAVILDAAPDALVVEQDLAGLAGAFRLRLSGADGFTTLAEANRLVQDPRIAWAEPDFLGSMRLQEIPNDIGFPNCWGLHNTGQFGCCSDIDMNGPETWDITAGHWQMRVLVIDSGIQLSHPDLNALPGRDFTNGDPDGFGDGSPLGSCDDHGTAVAGCIAARRNNFIGTVGMAPDSIVIGARVGLESCIDNTFDALSWSWVANALDWGFDQGIRISNSSIGGSYSSVAADAYDQTRANGMVHFGAAGNGGDDGIGDNGLVFPASLASINAVGAVQPNGTLAVFSNYGTGIMFAAPGTLVFTTDQTGADGYEPGEYIYFGGTSAASPCAAGAAAALWSGVPDLDAGSIEVILKLWARDLGATSYDTIFGWGMPDPRAALDAIGPVNNFCANAIDIVLSNYDPAPYSTDNATVYDQELQETCELNDVGVSNSVWYRFTPPCDGVIHVNTNGSDYDTVLSIWAGDCETAWEVACDDDGGAGVQSQLQDVAVFDSFVYYVKVADYGLEGGGMLDFNFQYTQPNDDCVDRTPIGAGSTEFCNIGATSSGFTHPECDEFGYDDVGADVFFEYVAACNGELTVSTCGDASYDTKIAVYGPSLGFLCPSILPGTSGALLGCNDDAVGCSGNTSELTVPVQSGEPYVIRLGGYFGAQGTGTLTLTCTVPGSPDLDGDGDVDIQDLLTLLGAWGTSDPVADIAPPGGDGTVDIQDLLALLSGWGTLP